MLTESARMNSAAEARFRIPAQPTDRNVKVIDLDTATGADVTRLVNEVPDADLVVMLVSAGSDAQAASTIGQACSEHRVMTHAIVVRAGAAADGVPLDLLREVNCGWSAKLRLTVSRSRFPLDPAIVARG